MPTAPTSFELSTGVVTNIERTVHHRLARSAENISILNESIAEDPNLSIRRCS